MASERDTASRDYRVRALGALLGAAGRLEHLLGQAIEDEFGISHTMYEVLLHLEWDGPSSMRLLGRKRVLTTGGVTRLVTRMEAAGLVTRAPDPADGRSQIVHMTEKGKDIVERASAMHARNVQRHFFDPVPAEHRKRLVQDLRKISEAADQALPRLR
ncbi:MarR family winged helix-turn-helix transcriptional regulator [Actinokineospora iranica]|uniref:MarR family winged helix-turn-helix transcriptional regulator n=1 Tax=Actinokineospora iranica TaxID=1271860 RepID=UPI001E4068E1|nr:MarR family winged helix-turn-helix transcriptional regulator [Actinokineospora iranica]